MKLEGILQYDFMLLKSNGSIFLGAISRKWSRGKTEVEIERREEEINVTEWVKDGDMRRTVELHRLTAEFLLLNCWILAELNVNFLTLLSLHGRDTHTNFRYENLKEGFHLDRQY